MTRRAVLSPQVTTSNISRAHQSQTVGPWAPETVVPRLSGETRTDTLKSKTAQQLSWVYDCLRQEGGTRCRKRNCKERIPWGQLQTACMVGPALAFQFFPGFSHPPPEPPPQETSPTSSVFTTIKWANVCRRRIPCHVKHSFKGSYCCGWGKGVQNWKNAGCGEACSKTRRLKGKDMKQRVRRGYGRGKL